MNVILGEDLGVFRDRGGRVGLLHRHCAHRRASLEYGRIEERGIRCCYHGWHFDVDATISAATSGPSRRVTPYRVRAAPRPIRCIPTAADTILRIPKRTDDEDGFLRETQHRVARIYFAGDAYGGDERIEYIRRELTALSQG